MDKSDNKESGMLLSGLITLKIPSSHICVNEINITIHKQLCYCASYSNNIQVLSTIQWLITEKEPLIVLKHFNKCHF